MVARFVPDPIGPSRDVVLGACTDIAIGLRPYIAAMS
jgi:hypothetical protein